MLALWISFFAYWRHNPGASVTANLSGNLAAPFSLVMCAAVIRNHRRAKLEHDWLDWACYALVGGTFIWWRVTALAVSTYVVCQIAMTLGYVRLIIHLAFQAEENTEPMLSWVVVLLGNILAVPKAVAADDGLALIFLARTIGLPAIVLGLMLRLECRRFATEALAYLDAENDYNDHE
ncbi:MAG: hypothetical protein HZA95_01420 [Candidatus Vogelbacteria bacterium]|nr:hypothetical protein [Candidatus Vogelbacteria bacterium]